MRNEVKYVITIIAAAGTVVAYANSTFMSKDIGDLIFKSLERIERKIDYTNQRIDRINEGN